VLDHISVDGKRKYCDEQGCFREADPLSLHNKCLRHSDQRCDFADCDNLIVSHGRCELHGGVVKHCKHGQLTGDCRVCYFRGSAFCKKHGRVKSQCKDCGPQKLKEQNIVLDPISVDGKRKYCDEQGCSEDTKNKPAPAGQTVFVFGDHSVQRVDTTDMPEMRKKSGKGKQCPHGRTQKNSCKKCGGTNICTHGRVKYFCKECGFVRKKCPHGRQKSVCKLCNGSEICEHMRRKCKCKLCHGSQICQHNKQKQSCVHCGGSAITYRRRVFGCIDCKDWPIWNYGSKRYDGRCFLCHTHKFPNDPRVRVELVVREYINRHFKNFIHDRTMDTAHCDCTLLRRIDHRCMIGGTLLCIETDEHYHRCYKQGDEDARYHDVMMGHGGNLCFVRFNPDRFSREDEGPPLEERLERLHAEITRHIGRLERGENNSLLEVWYLYYPEGTPDFYDENTSPYLQEDDEESAPEGQ
jgi:hypothetical protein